MLEPKGFGISQEVIIYPIATSPKGALVYYEVDMFLTFGLGEPNFLHASYYHADEAGREFEILMYEWFLLAEVEGEDRYKLVGILLVMIERILLFGMEVLYGKLEGIRVIPMVNFRVII
jgi:hypothetical protein